MSRAVVSQRPHLQRSPLVLTLAEIRFAPVLAIEQHVPAIQDDLRRKGFPGFSVAQEQQLQFGPDGPVLLEPTRRWIFTSEDDKRSVTLTPASVAIQVRDYSTFENMLSAIQSAITVVAEKVSPVWAGRVGLRYVDAVQNVGSDLSAVFTEAVRTFSPEDLGVISLLSNQQIVARTNAGQLIIRMNQVEDSPIIPPDLNSGEFQDLGKPVPGTHAILDIDSSDEGRSAFDVAALTNRLWGVHEPASAGFWRSITDDAKAKWGMTFNENSGVN